MSNFKKIGVRRSFLVQNPNTFIWLLDRNGVKTYHQVSNSTDNNSYTLVTPSYIYCEPRYIGIQAGILSGSGIGLNIRGLGTIILSNNNTYTGTTIIEQSSTLQLGNGGVTGAVGGSLQINSGGTLIVYTGASTYSRSNVLSGSGNLILKGTGASDIGSFRFTGANTFTGQVILKQSSFAFGSGYTTTWNTTSIIIVEADSQVALVSTTLPNTLSISGQGWLQSLGRLGALNYNGANTLSGNLIVPNSATISNYTTSTDTLLISGIISGVGQLTIAGTGTVTINNTNNSKTGGYVCNGGTTIFSAGAFGSGIVKGVLTINSGATANLRGSGTTNASFPLGFSDTINVNNGGTLVISNALNQDNGCYVSAINLVNTGTLCTVSTPDSSSIRGGFNVNTLITSSGTVGNTWGVPIILVNGNGRTFTINNSNDLTINSVVSDYTGLGGLQFTKTGTGNLILTAINTFTGAFALANTSGAGTVSLSGSGSISSASGLVIAFGCTFNISSVTASTSTIPSIIGNGNIILGVKTLVVNFASTSTSHGGVISGTGGLTKQGTGTQVLTGNNTYTGSTLISGGILSFQGTNQSATTTVSSGATISGGTAITGNIKALTFSASTSQYNVYMLLPNQASRLTCTTLTATLGFTINVLGTMNVGTYPILISTTGTPTPTLGTNTTGRTVVFAWVGQTLNMILT